MRGPGKCEKYEQYVREHKEFLSEPIIQNFLMSKKNLNLLKQAVCEPNTENNRALEIAFREFYADIRLRSYIATIIHRHAIYHDKSQRRRNYRFLLIFDSPLVNSEATATTYGETVPSKGTLEQITLTDERFQLDDLIDNTIFLKTYKSLSSLQQATLEMAYVQEMSDKEIADKLGCSRQAVTKTRNRALKKLRSQLEKGDE